jgi:peptidoglycan/LPS O-acetylase OafA/YrhL
LQDAGTVGDTVAPLRPRLANLGYLRFVAALAVLTFHWGWNGIQNGKLASLSHTAGTEFLIYGYFGVHLFFLISGFLISVSARGKSPAQFAVGRALRLYPAFWAALAVTTIASVIWGGELMTVNAAQVAVNATLVPGWFGVQAVDGVYWTLQYEALFYLLILALLFLRLADRIDTLLTWWAILMGGVTVVVPQVGELPLLGGFYSFFAGGAVLSSVWRTGWSPFRALGLTAAITAGVLYTLRALPSLSEARGTEYDPIATSAIIVAIYALLALTIVRPGQAVVLRGDAVVGALTYPLYLLHAHVGYMLLTAIATPENQVFAYVTAMGVILAASWCLHRWVEIAGGPMWTSLFERLVGGPIDVVTRLLRLLVGRRPVSGGSESSPTLNL